MKQIFKQLMRDLARARRNKLEARLIACHDHLRQGVRTGLHAVAAGASVLTVMSLPLGAGPAYANEVMTDRCSANVAIPTTGYGQKPDAEGTIILMRPASGWSEWTPPFSVQKGPGGRIRWWCNSTIGNTWDLGTWGFNLDIFKALSCSAQIFGKSQSDDEVGVEDLKCIGDAIKVEPGASAYNGWTPERSRCSNRSNLIRARLGPSRRLQIECLGRVASTVSPLKSSTSCRQLMARDWDASSTQPIVNFWSQGRLDNSLMSNPAWRSCPGDFESPDYRAFRVEGLVLKSRQGASLPMVPLYHYYNPGTNDNATTRSLWVSGLARSQQPARGYRFSAVAGYIFAPSITPNANMAALYTWYDPARRDFFTTTQSNWAGGNGDRKGNYIFVRHEGYVLKAN